MIDVSSASPSAGHSFGLKHELGEWFYTIHGAYTNEYGCPYSVMSADRNYSFDRAPDPRLPGVAGPTNPQRTVGPYLPSAHLYINQYKPVNPNGVFNHADTVTYVPASYEHTPAKVRLVARDSAIAAWPNRAASAGGNSTDCGGRRHTFSRGELIESVGQQANTY